MIALIISLCIFISAGLFAINAWLGFAFAVGILGVVIFLIYPPLLIYISIVVSGFHTALGFIKFEIGNTTVTPVGFIWPAFALLIILFLFTSTRSFQIPKYLFGFLIFSFWALMRWLMTPTGLSGIKDILWYSYPLFFGLFIHNSYINKKLPRLLIISKYTFGLILTSSLIPAFLYLFSFITGNASFSTRGPEGPFFASRAISIFLLIPFGVALATSKIERIKPLSKFTQFLNFGMIIGSLSRMASVTAVGILSIQRFFSKNWKRFLFPLIFGSLISLIAITQVPLLRARFFHGTDKISGIFDAARRLNVMGRENFWHTTFNSALERPIFGKGLGSARKMLALIYRSNKENIELHPHNEYLQVFHDLGLIGLILLLNSWLGLFFRNYSRWKKSSSGITKAWSLSTMLSIIILLFLAITDNPFHFPSVLIMESIVFSFTEIYSRK